MEPNSNEQVVDTQTTIDTQQQQQPVEQQQQQPVQQEQQQAEQQQNQQQDEKAEPPKEEEQQEEQSNKKRELRKHFVQSSNLDWVAYDKVKKDLYIQFRSGGFYRYLKVPEDIFTSLLNAGSKGRYHNIKIKYKYEYEKLN